MALPHDIHASTLFSALATSSPLRLTVFCLVYLGIWRIWKFTLRPRLYPDEPKTYPYWIPFIGHTISFFRDAEETMYKARMYFNNIREPFQLVIMGQVVYVITSAQDTTQVLKSDAYSQDPWLFDLLHQFGASSSSVKAMWTAVPKPEKGAAHKLDPELGLRNWEQKSLKDVCTLVFRHALNHSQHSDVITNILFETMHARMDWDSIPAQHVFEKSDNTCQVSLLKWSQHVLLEGATRSFFGDLLLDIEPDLFESFFGFDDSSWKVVYQIPNFLATDVQSTKRVAEETLAKYFDQPPERRKDASVILHEIESIMRASGIQSKDMGILVLLFYWVINANAWKATFWMISEIVRNDSLRSAIMEEIAPLITPEHRPALSPGELATQLQQCEILNSVYNETLRLTSASTSVRFVLEDSWLGGFKLRKGTRMVIPYRQQMLNDKTFGEDCANFNSERFLKDPSLLKNPNYRPFGGGATLCPGKTLAQKEMLTFVALALGKFQARLPVTKEQRECSVPRMNTWTPCIGVMGPVDAENFCVTITKPKW